MFCDLNDIEKIIGYVFKDKGLLTQAFTHSSYANEHKQSRDYERLEYIGDATLGYITGVLLYERFPCDKEGSLSKKRANLVSAETLSKVIDELGLIKYMRVGQGTIEKDVFLSQDIKCDLFESIVGAILMDTNKNIDATAKFALKYLQLYVDSPIIDYTSLTYEYCAKTGKKIEFKEVKAPNGEFAFELCVENKTICIGRGHNKQSAKKAACEIFYKKYIKSV